METVREVYREKNIVRANSSKSVARVDALPNAGGLDGDPAQLEHGGNRGEDVRHVFRCRRRQSNVRRHVSEIGWRRLLVDAARIWRENAVRWVEPESL